jgi:hypothetical protein
MPEMRGFDGSPMLFLFNKRLPLSTMGTDDIGFEPRFHNLNQWGSGHSVFLLSLKNTLSSESHNPTTAERQNRERVEYSGLSISRTKN